MGIGDYKRGSQDIWNYAIDKLETEDGKRRDAQGFVSGNYVSTADSHRADLEAREMGLTESYPADPSVVAPAFAARAAFEEWVEARRPGPDATEEERRRFAIEVKRRYLKQNIGGAMSNWAEDDKYLDLAPDEAEELRRRRKSPSALLGDWQRPLGG